MRVYHCTDVERWIKGGIKSAIRQQRKALDAAGVEYVTEEPEEYDVLHLNTLGPRSIRAFRSAQKRGIPVVMHTHTTGEDFKRSMRFSNVLAPAVDRYTAFFYRRADRLIAPSQHTETVLRSKGLDGISVVSNGVDTERLDGFASLEGTDAFTAINLGLVFERKGLSDFIATGKELPDVRFRWYGPRLNRLLASYTTNRRIRKAPANVRFPGFIDDIREAFAEADVFFFPTREENQGISLLEAAYCGVPIVVRDIPTYDGWLEHGTDCLKADDVHGFVAALRRLKEDPALREELGENARAMAEEHTLDVVGEELRSVYERVLHRI